MVSWEERKASYNEHYFTTYSGMIKSNGEAAYIGHEERIIQSVKILLDLTDAHSVLECGCAAGQFVYGFHLLDPNIVARGFDVSEFVIKHAPELIRSKLDILDISDGLPYGDEEFELVLSFDMLEHLQDYKRIYRSVEETCRVSSKYVLLRIPMIAYFLPYAKDSSFAEKQKVLTAWIASLNVLPHTVRLTLIDVHPYIKSVSPNLEVIEHPNEHPREFWIECFKSCGFREKAIPEKYYYYPNLLGLHSFNTLFFTKDKS